MANLDALHMIYRINQVVLNIAREEKPSGSWPEWVEEADIQLTTIERELRLQAKGTLHAFLSSQR